MVPMNTSSNTHIHNMNMPKDMGAMQGGMGTGMESMHGGMMKMYFHFTLKSEILFKWCTTNSYGGIITACIVIFIVAMLYEGLKVLREVLLHNHEKAKLFSTGQPLAPSCVSSGDATGVYVIGGDKVAQLSFRDSLLNAHHILQTLLHMIQITISYALMLIFMTYNIWLCIAVVLGAGTGYFLFGWKRTVIVDSNEHCH